MPPDTAGRNADQSRLERAKGPSGMTDSDAKQPKVRGVRSIDSKLRGASGPITGLDHQVAHCWIPLAIRIAKILGRHGKSVLQFFLARKKSLRAHRATSGA